MFIEENYKYVRRHSSKLLNFLHLQEGIEEKNGLWKFVNGVWDDVVRISTVHGVRKIFLRTSKVIERLLLIVGFITAIYFFTSITRSIIYIYRYKPLETVISDLHLPIYKIPFPEVMICNKNRLNWQRYNAAKSKFLKPQHLHTQHELAFRETVNAYDTLRFSRYNRFKNISELYSPQLLQDLDYVNFTLVVEFMSWKCYEIFSNCSWENLSIDCCEIFSARRSQKGFCLSFNTIESAEGAIQHRRNPYYPLRTLRVGSRNGLRFSIHLREGWHSPFSLGTKGVLVMIVEPSVWAYHHHEIPTNTRALISITAFLHVHNENTRLYSAEVRKCVFEDELESVFYKSLINHQYMFENCHSECEQEYLMKFCNCTLDLPCLYRHDEKLKIFEQLGESEYVKFFQKGMYCPCYLNCKSLNYFLDYRVEHKTSQDNINPNNTEVEMAVFFLWDSIMVYETTAIYPLIDLMASLGGLAGLCIGCSLIGITELLYFFLFDIPKQGTRCLRSPQGLPVKRERLNSKMVFVRQYSIRE